MIKSLIQRWRVRRWEKSMRYELQGGYYSYSLAVKRARELIKIFTKDFTINQISQNEVRLVIDKFYPLLDETLAIMMPVRTKLIIKNKEWIFD